MGNIREKPEKSKNTQVYRHKKLTYVTSSMCGWRTYMEDSTLAIYPYCQNEDMGLFGIFDGHGGPQCSEYASKYFPQILKKNQNFKSKNYGQALTQTFLKIDQMMKSNAGMKQLVSIRQKHFNNGNAENYHGNTISGTTANVCLLTKQFIYVANAGDSRAIGILRGNKTKSKLKVLSKDHKPEDEIEKQRIIKAGGTVNQQGRINNNLNLSRALGDFYYKSNEKLKVQEQIISPVPQIQTISRIQISHILMGCDGIWESKTSQQMAKWFIKSLQVKNASLRTIIQSLFNEQLAIGNDKQNGLDNMSAIIIQI